MLFPSGTKVLPGLRLGHGVGPQLQTGLAVHDARGGDDLVEAVKALSTAKRCSEPPWPNRTGGGRATKRRSAFGGIPELSEILGAAPL